MADSVATQCDHCGQNDDHPKSHWNSGQTFHLDCLPFDLRRQLSESHPLAKEQIDAALNGVHGDKLRAHITKLHEDHADVVAKHFGDEK